jgi:hypothetical protein
MSTSPLTPKTLKGALVSISLTSLPSLVLFQYQPETLTRSLKPRRAPRDDFASCGAGESIKLAGPPQETIRFTLQLDATDGLETRDPIALSTGVASGLAALEVMIAPSKILVFAAQVLRKAGVIDALPEDPPVTLLFLGPTRILPVNIESLNVTEEAFDTLLNPIRARVEVDLTVLGPDDLQDSNPAYLWALNYSTVVKEALALVASGANATAAAGSIFQAVTHI